MCQFPEFLRSTVNFRERVFVWWLEIVRQCFQQGHFEGILMQIDNNIGEFDRLLKTKKKWQMLSITRTQTVYQHESEQTSWKNLASCQTKKLLFLKVSMPIFIFIYLPAIGLLLQISSGSLLSSLLSQEGGKFFVACQLTNKCLAPFPISCTVPALWRSITIGCAFHFLG